MSDANPSPQKTEKVKRGALEALADSERLTPEEREEIASTITAEVAKLLPNLPEGIAEMAARAVGLSLGITEQLVDAPAPAKDPPDEQSQ